MAKTIKEHILLKPTSVSLLPSNKNGTAYKSPYTIYIKLPIVLLFIKPYNLSCLLKPNFF